MVPQTQSTTIATGQSLYQFKVVADPAGPVDVDQVSFNVATSGAATLNLSSFILYDITGGNAVQVGSTMRLWRSPRSTVTFNLGTSQQQIGAGQTKTYELVATVAGWATAGTSVTVSLAQDTSALVAGNGYSTDSALTGSKIVWSDRSATGHASGGASVGTQDWTNGYLLNTFVNNATTYTHQ